MHGTSVTASKTGDPSESRLGKCARSLAGAEPPPPHAAAAGRFVPAAAAAAGPATSFPAFLAVFFGRFFSAVFFRPPALRPGRRLRGPETTSPRRRPEITFTARPRRLGRLCGSSCLRHGQASARTASRARTSGPTAGRRARARRGSRRRLGRPGRESESPPPEPPPLRRRLERLPGCRRRSVPGQPPAVKCPGK